MNLDTLSLNFLLTIRALFFFSFWLALLFMNLIFFFLNNFLAKFARKYRLIALVLMRLKGTQRETLKTICAGPDFFDILLAGVIILIL
jgi:hypothetical protein